MTDKTLDRSTPRPWSINKDCPWQVDIGSYKDHFFFLTVDTCGKGTTKYNEQEGEREANASLIVKAVNDYDTLLKEKEELRESAFEYRELSEQRRLHIEELKASSEALLEACRSVKDQINDYENMTDKDSVSISKATLNEWFTELSQVIARSNEGNNSWKNKEEKT